METPAIGTTGFAPGWHPGRPMADYLGDPAVSASLLWKLHESTPGHLIEDLRSGRGRVSTDAKDLGSLLHTRVYEPALFDDQYVVLGQCEATKGDGTRCSNGGSIWRDGQSFCGLKGHDPGKGAPMPPEIQTVTSAQHASAIAMDATLKAHYSVGQILRAEGAREVTGVWKDPESGLWCRIRPDQLIEAPTGTPERWHYSVVNLKSTGKVASGESFRRDFENMGHPFKAAFYRMGMRELWDVEPQNFLYPTVETYPPYAVILHRLHEDWLDIVEDDVRHALRTLAGCIEAGHWPAYPIEVHDLNLPDWRRKRLQMLDSLDVEEVAA